MMLKILAWMALLLGILIRYSIGRRRFKRRNVAGLQQFRSYESAILIRLFEKISGLIAWMMIAGGLLVLLLD